MRNGRPSLTAQRVALSRAAHQLYDHPKLLDDPIALRIIGAQCAEELRAHRRRFDARFARYLRAFVVARSRIAEDALAAAVGRGVRQYVVLGAGLDTLAYRNPYPLRVFEVDHPATQAWKRRQLSAAEISLPPSLTLVPVDFETQPLARALHEAGLRADEPTFFSWLGVSMYLTRTAVLATLKRVASSPEGSGIVFDYAVPPASVSLVRRLVLRALLRRLAAIGEPWKAVFDPHELAAELYSLGFTHSEDFGPAELNARFFRDRSDGLRVAGPGRVVSTRL